MNSGKTESTDWLDAELRRVPLPDGLVARLQQSAACDTDDELDARLSAVVVPPTLAAGLRCAIADAQIDERLASVAVPSDLTAKLLAAIDDAALDEQVADVATPVGLVQRLRGAAAPGPLRRLAMAASVLIAVGLSYGGVKWLIGSRGSNDLAAERTGRPIEIQPDPEVDLDAIVSADGNVGTSELDASGLEAGELAAAEIDAQLDLMPPWPDLFDMETTIAGGSVAQELSRAFGDGRADGSLATRWQAEDRIVGFTVETEKFPSFVTVAPRRASGIAPPLASGYDRTALARWGVHPFVQPARNDVLRVSVAPLWTRTDSFDLLFERLANRQRTNDIAIRPEDFLATMNYEFPPAPAGRLALRTAAGPAPFLDSRVGMIQIGVQAGPSISTSRRPVHLTLAVDDSSAMQWHGRRAIVREALRDLVAELEEHDRVSLIAFSDRADVLARDKGPQDAAELRTAIGWLKPDGGANLEAAMRAACGAAIEGEVISSARRCVVVISDSAGDLSDAKRDAIGQMIDRAAAKSVEFIFVELAAVNTPDPVLKGLARDPGGKYRLADNRRDLARHLNEAVSARPGIVARGAELRVAFNPQAVAEYRLIGHEPNGASTWSADPVASADLAAGETATALYQVVLRENNVNDVATAELIWRDAASGKIERLTQRISRLQFATSFLDSAPSLQAAALAAETAEVLRQSYFTPRGAHSLDRVAAMAAHSNPRLREQKELKRLLRLAEMARQAGMDR